ncbi:MAG: dTDP-4-dehydrorhamnose 3,5-epimerase family protein [Oscillospiraceae bacterium]
MTLGNLSLPNCKEIKYVFTDDSNRFGNRRYSWFFTRDKKIEADYRFRYVAGIEELTLADEELNIAVTCLQGSFTVTVENEDGKTGCYTISGLQGNTIVITGAISVQLTSQLPDSQIFIMSEKNIPDVSDDISFSKKTDGITLIHTDTTGEITPVYSGDVFCRNGITGFMNFVNYDTMRFADTFRGMYCQIGPREYSSLITCVNGSADIYAIDLRRYSETYKQSFVVHLDSINDAVFFQAGFALGTHSKSDNSALLSFTNNYYDKKFQRVINVSDCDKAADIIRPELIMSTLDRYADKLGEGNNTDL